MLCSRLYGLRYSLRPYLNGARWSPRPCSRDRDVAFFRADFARLCYRLPLPPRWSLCQWNSAPNIGGNDNVPSCLLSPEVSAFLSPFSSSSYSLILMPILILAFIGCPDGNSGISLAQNRIACGNAMCFRSFLASLICVSIREIIIMRICNVVLMPRSANLCPYHFWSNYFVNRMPGP